MCNPSDATPCVDGTSAQDAIEHDARSAAQRNHDALTAADRALLASGDLGQHNGLPATSIVTTTLRELEAGAGKALTGGGTLLPMGDVIRLASHAHHCLCIFDKATPSRSTTRSDWPRPVSELCCTPIDARVMRDYGVGDASPSTACRLACCGD